MKTFRLSCVVVLTLACGLSSEEQFLGKSQKDDCDGTVPVCSTTAGCRLGEDLNYVDMSVPGYRNFVVNTEGEADLILHFLWKKQLSPGQDVEMTFFEPGCGDPHRFETSGDNMFRSIGQDKQWEVQQTVYQGGDHMVEVRMDAQGEFLLKVEIVTPPERGQPKKSSEAPEPELPNF